MGAIGAGYPIDLHTHSLSVDYHQLLRDSLTRLPTVAATIDSIRKAVQERGEVVVLYFNFDHYSKVEEVKPALVLLDVMMPGRDGWQVCREMKQHPTLGRSVRIVMVTALDDWVNKRQALQTGADDFVEKPFELSKLVATVERNLKLVSSNAASASSASPAR